MNRTNKYNEKPHQLDNIEKVYLHAINTGKEYNSLTTIKIFSEILKSNYLLSLKLQNKETKGGFNGEDYISLCDYQKRNIINSEPPPYLLEEIYPDGYNSYNCYIRRSLSLAFDKNLLEVTIPQIVPISIKTKEGYNNMKVLGEHKENRYSDMPDEVQVKDYISLDKMVYLTFPLHQLLQNYIIESQTIKTALKHINTINNLLFKYGYDIPIYDIDTLETLEDEPSIQKVLKKHRKPY